jgi:hypothetical protein
VKHTEQPGIWVPTQHLLWDQGNPRKTLIDLAGRREPSLITSWHGRRRKHFLLPSFSVYVASTH